MKVRCKTGNDKVDVAVAVAVDAVVVVGLSFKSLRVEACKAQQGALSWC